MDSLWHHSCQENCPAPALMHHCLKIWNSGSGIDLSHMHMTKFSKVGKRPPEHLALKSSDGGSHRCLVAREVTDNVSTASLKRWHSKLYLYHEKSQPHEDLKETHSSSREQQEQESAWCFHGTWSPGRLEHSGQGTESQEMNPRGGRGLACATFKAVMGIFMVFLLHKGTIGF